MPAKQTRESIKAELNASPRGRIVKRFKEFIHDLDVMETELRELETARGIFDAADRPIAERLEAVGLDRSAAMAREALDAMTKAALGRVDEIPEHLKRDLAKMADAEISALDQLQDILDASGNGRDRGAGAEELEAVERSGPRSRLTAPTSTPSDQVLSQSRSAPAEPPGAAAAAGGGRRRWR